MMQNYCALDNWCIFNVDVDVEGFTCVDVIIIQCINCNYIHKFAYLNCYCRENCCLTLLLICYTILSHLLCGTSFLSHSFQGLDLGGNISSITY